MFIRSIGFIALKPSYSFFTNCCCRNSLIHDGYKTSVRRLADCKMSYIDTIYALSSGQVIKSGISVIRLSGPSSFKVLDALSTHPTPDSLPNYSRNMPKPRVASLRNLYCPETKEKLDQAIVITFPGPRSFTGEDVVELHVHGSRAVISGLFKAFEYCDKMGNELNIRPAERGEFTKRAFDNGRMDLTEVEGLSDLLDADTSEQRKQALKQMDGVLRKKFEAWREELVGCLAHTEAVIDFGDDDREDDVSDATFHQLTPRIKNLMQQLQHSLNTAHKGELVREGVKIALAGLPNAGKSSLLNALAGRPAAIVSPIAGTTRDIVEVRLDLGGLSCILSDTAGLRIDSNDIIEMEGMKRAREAFQLAQLKVFVIDESDQNSLQSSVSVLQSLLNNDNNNNENKMNENDNFSQQNIMIVLNKCDQTNNIDTKITFNSILSELFVNNTTTNNNHDTYHDINNNRISYYRISCKDGIGLEELEKGMTHIIQTKIINNNNCNNNSNVKESIIITRDRHRRHVRKCVEHLNRFLYARLPMDAAAEEI
eukprot:gene10159-13666_t